MVYSVLYHSTISVLCHVSISPKDQLPYPHSFPFAALAKDHDVQLMIHNDPRVMIDDSDLDRLLLSAVTNSWSVSEEGATGWRPNCLLRYSAMVKGRGVIKTKGYTLKATKL